MLFFWAFVNKKINVKINVNHKKTGVTMALENSRQQVNFRH